MAIMLRPWDCDEGLALVWTHWSWSLSVSIMFLPLLSVPLQVPALGSACHKVSLWVWVCLYLLCVDGWSSTAVSRRPYLHRRDTGQRGPLCVTLHLWKLTALSLCVCAKDLECFSVSMRMQTMSTAALFHECILIARCIPRGVCVQKAHRLLIAQVTFDLRFKSHVF